jgi:serine/threonine-protein phosphatase 2B catalytic subunit|mmetsp:Transcript_13357/g.18246  ORF Transcript_13357/g.18246 Transcript_13357/m.18246 type:complete len:190 (+) Transcript_13357:113-682(+)
MVEHHHHTRTVASAEDYPLERLEDPCNDRKMRDVPRPPRYPMTVANLYETRDGKEVPKMDLIRKHLMIEGHIEKDCLTRILRDVSKIYRSEPNMLRVEEPVIIIGDIHGQFFDMIHMFEKVVDTKGIPQTNLLFLGDYVDRGIFSLEVCVFLFCLKINFPRNVTMLRGNHESRAMTEHFTFRSEILQKF